MKKSFLLILSLFLLVSANAQTETPPSPVSKVRSKYACPGEMTITYNLYLPDNAQTADITVYYSTNGRNYYPCITVSGDLVKQSSGSGKAVVWDMRADGFRTGYFVFRVEAKVERECVTINGVCWATRNVGAPNTFVEKPEDAGMFYQWNRNVAWSATNPLVNSTGGTVWDNSIPTGNAWETTNNVCPTGFRVPTLAEQISLSNAGSVWTTINGVNGRVFGSGDSTIFLPAAGYRDNSNGSLLNRGSYGFYWSTGQYSSSTRAYGSHFDNGSTLSTTHYPRGYGLSVRCVAE